MVLKGHLMHRGHQEAWEMLDGVAWVMQQSLCVHAGV